jgi:hypothetical protein
MPDGVAFTEELADRVIAATKWVESHRGHNPTLPHRTPWGGSGPVEIAIARITSGTVDGNGNYPAVITYPDPTKTPFPTWTDLGAIKVMPLQVETLTSGVRYWVRPAGVLSTDVLYVSDGIVASVPDPDGADRTPLAASNTTCDIYRTGNAPPAAPDVAAVSCYLAPVLPGSQGPLPASTQLDLQGITHTLQVPLATDLRDDWPGGVFVYGPAADKIYVPDKNGVRFDVVLVRRFGYGSGSDYRGALLIRTSGGLVAWPSNDV